MLSTRVRLRTMNSRSIVIVFGYGYLLEALIVAITLGRMIPALQGFPYVVIADARKPRFDVVQSLPRKRLPATAAPRPLRAGHCRRVKKRGKKWSKGNNIIRARFRISFEGTSAVNVPPSRALSRPSYPTRRRNSPSDLVHNRVFTVTCAFPKLRRSFLHIPLPWAMNSRPRF